MNNQCDIEFHHAELVPAIFNASLIPSQIAKSFSAVQGAEAGFFPNPGKKICWI
jgi:hypothetical protein